MYERLTALQEGLIPKKKAATDDDLHRINELIQVGPVASQHKITHLHPTADIKNPCGFTSCVIMTRGTSRKRDRRCLEQTFSG